MSDRVLHTVTNRAGQFLFLCPGCKCAHAVWTDSPNEITGARWSFDGNMEKPTFSPSLLIDYGGHPERPRRCHLYVTDGKLQFLDDSDHAYKGRTIDMVPF